MNKPLSTNSPPSYILKIKITYIGTRPISTLYAPTPLKPDRCIKSGMGSLHFDKNMSKLE